eukprot:2184682-Pleurochrysis_carterae.AAC.1
MASPVPACVSAVFPEALARLRGLAEDRDFIAANGHIRVGFYEGFVAPLLAAFSCQRSAALQVTDDFE